MHPMLIALLSNLMQLRSQGELGSYETICYQQLLITAKAQARLNELMIQQTIRDYQDGKGIDQAPGGITSSPPEDEEYRGDDHAPTV